MAKEGNSAVTASWRELFSLALYKRSQGRIVRQVTFGVLVVLLGLGAWSLNNFLEGKVPVRADNVTITVKLIAPIAMEEGLRFAIREGGRTVGAGVVAKIIE